MNEIWVWSDSLVLILGEGEFFIIFYLQIFLLLF